MTKILVAVVALFILSIASFGQSKSEKRAEKACAEHPDWTAQQCELIGKKRIGIGMTKAMVIAAWGRPYHANKTITANNLSEQWVYMINDFQVHKITGFVGLPAKLDVQGLRV